jgi:hypothetical protein
MPVFKILVELRLKILTGLVIGSLIITTTKVYIGVQQWVYKFCVYGPQLPKIKKSRKCIYLYITAQYHHLLPLMGFPLDLISLAHLWGISAMRCRISSIVILSHSSWRASFISSSELKILQCSCCFIIDQIPSIGLRSGLWARWIRF